MNAWSLALGALAVIFFFMACALGNRCIEFYNTIRDLEAKNADLRYSVRVYKDEMETMRTRIPDGDQITRLKLELHLKQERIDALNAKLKEQRILLQQKWEGARK